MSAEPVPNPAPEPAPANAKRDPIVAFREDYALHVHEAEVSEAHTATEGWQAIYSGVRRDMLKERVRIANGLRRVADLLDESGLTEDDEKDVGDFKKAAVELRERWEMFERDVIAPVKRPYQASQDCIAHYRGVAERMEHDSPLVFAGLVELMRTEIGKVRVVRWDEESGRIVVAA